MKDRPEADRAGEAGRSRNLLQALTGALHALGSAGDEVRALTESFEHAVRAFDAEKALLLRVRDTSPLTLENLRATGLSEEQIAACIRGESIAGVSPSQIRRAIESGEPQLVAHSQLECCPPNVTASLKDRPYSVLCAPVLDAWTRATLAVLYFQGTPGPQGYGVDDIAFVRAYANALGHAFGLFLTSERRYRALQEDCRSLRQAISADAPDIVGDSEDTHRLRAEIENVFLPVLETEKPRPILILGDTGTGKDLVARYLHYYSALRGRGPLVEHNCAGLSGDLAQSTLFGHARGAFTGAVDASPGLFRAANGGVLFLDEIGAMPARGQELLLKVLDHWLVQPLGDTRSYSVDVQLLCATSQDLAAAVQSGQFRQDLHQRLKALTIRLTPLASRPGDVLPLLSHFLSRAEKSLRRRIRGLRPDALRRMLRYPWPGNVRELSGACYALVAQAPPGGQIGVEDLERHCPDVVRRSDGDPARALHADRTVAGSFHEARNRFERDLLVNRLDIHGWNVPEAARSLKISVATLYRLLQRHGLRRSESPS